MTIKLNEDDHPILFEGLHTTFPINSGQLNGKKIFVRAHNVEHDFYDGLAKSENSVFKKRFFKQEAKKLKKYEKVLEKVNGIFTISPFEQRYFYEKYGNHCHYIPAFHNHEIQTELTNSEQFVLYHGNISVSENSKAASFLIDIYKRSGFELVIASGFENSELLKEIENHSNISFVKLDQPGILLSLFERAQVHVLPTFQKTGIKLKLLNTLYQGRHIIVNDFMVEDTGLETLCHIANKKEDFLKKTAQLMSLEFLSAERKNRLKVLENFDPIQSAQKMIDIIFTSDF